MPLPSKWGTTNLKAKPKKHVHSEWRNRVLLEPKKEENQMMPPAEPVAPPVPEERYGGLSSQDHISYATSLNRGLPAKQDVYYPMQGPPSPPRESPAPSLPPRPQAIPVLYEEDTNRAQSVPLEFVTSPPADGRETRTRKHPLPPVSYENLKPRTSVERRRSDSHRNNTIQRSASPVSTQRTISTNFSTDRPLQVPMRPGSNDSRQEKQGDAGKQESASILDDLMERHERKALETRKAHEKELRTLQKENAQSLDQLRQELMDAKQSYSMELRSLKEEKHEAEAKWQNMYNAMETQREEANMARRELEELKANQTAEIDRERQVLDRTRSHIDGLERDLAKLADKYERRLQEQAEKHQQTVSRMQDESVSQAVEMKKQIAVLKMDIDAQTHEIDKMTGHEGSLQKEINALRKQCDSFQARATAHQEEIRNLKDAWAVEIKKQHDYYENRRANLEELLQKQQVDHDQERARFEAGLKQQKAEFAQEMERRVAYYEDQNYRLRADHRQQLEAATLHLKKRILSLESDLVDNGDDMRPSLGGGPLQSRYRELQLKIETVTQPFNLGDMTSPHGFATDQLDERGFLAKEGKGQLRFLLRSICWSIIMDGFFSSPFGFGALGPGEGKKLLLEVYATWQRLFDPNFTAVIAAPGFSDQEDFEPFYNDKFANWWRSATFRSIQSVVLPSRRASQAGKPADAGDERPQGIAKIFADNVACVKGNILGVITKVCGVDKASDVIESEVDALVRCASLLAVEFGAHGAKICFGMPKRGDTVQIGPEFVDCEDGDSNRGRLETVELAVTPSLFMIGDGRKDLTTASCLYPGEIYPQRGS